jgi:hypothetical protein
VPRIHLTTMLSSLAQDGQIGDMVVKGMVVKDMVVKGVATKREKHEVVPPLVVGRRGF